MTTQDQEVERLRAFAADLEQKLAACPPEFGNEYRYLLSINKMMKECRPERPDWKYQTYYDLVLDLAAPMRRATFDLPDGYKTMQAKECYRNAGTLALEHPGTLLYCEGYAQTFGLFIEHAWVETLDGTIIDPTWAGLHDESEYGTYLGVRFAPQVIAAETVDSGYWSVFQSDWELEHRALRYGFDVTDGIVTGIRK
jgi:hypothetical protein